MNINYWKIFSTWYYNYVITEQSHVTRSRRFLCSDFVAPTLATSPMTLIHLPWCHLQISHLRPYSTYLGALLDSHVTYFSSVSRPHQPPSPQIYDQTYKDWTHFRRFRIFKSQLLPLATSFNVNPRKDATAQLHPSRCYPSMLPL